MTTNRPAGSIFERRDARLSMDARAGLAICRAVDRGRTLHPWRGYGRQYLALLGEMSELAWELARPSRDPVRIREEALDVVVVAYRIFAGY